MPVINDWHGSGSNMGFGGEDSSLTIRGGAKGLGIEDSELSNSIIGTGHIDRKKGATLNLSSIDPAKKKQKFGKDKKKKKKSKSKHRRDSSDEGGATF